MSVLIVLWVAACGADVPVDSAAAPASDLSQSDANQTADACLPNEPDPTRYVTVGFWTEDTCAGEPMMTNSLPVDGDAPCYCWPG